MKLDQLDQKEHFSETVLKHCTNRMIEKKLCKNNGFIRFYLYVKNNLYVTL